MRGWPPIHDPKVLEWLALEDAQWREVVVARILAFGARPYDDAALEHALGYPWPRPAGSYVLRDGAVAPIEELDPGDRRAVVSEFAAGRHPLVAFGANGAPSRLQDRFAEFEDPADREALVLTGELHDVDVGAQASPTAFGTVPGALFASPGTAVRASVLWLTTRQLEQIAFAELGYRLGRLERARFVMDEAVVTVDDLFAFVSRVGALRLDGEPVALAAIPATGRTARAMTQAELLEVMGALAIGPGASAGDMVRMCFEDMASVLDTIPALTWPDAVRLPDDHWKPYPANGSGGS